MEVLEGMEDADDIAYFKALEKFTNSDWRRIIALALLMEHISVHGLLHQNKFHTEVEKLV
ncbi:unnamed protein product [Malus baccata var. baccata]